MTPRIGIAVMGCSQFAERSAIPAILDQQEKFNLVGIASRSAEKASRFAEQFGCRPFVGYESLLADASVDMVYMPLPTGLHAEWVEKCQLAGKHLLVEKSMAETMPQAEHMIALARDKQLLIAENFMFQYHRQMDVVKDLLAQGVIGELRQLRSSFGFPPLPADNFRFNKSLGGGALLDAGAYTLKAAQYFLGTELEVLSASLTDTMSAGVDTLGAAHLVAKSGVSALLGFGFDNFYQCNFEIWGSAGKLTATRAFTAKPGFEPEIIVERQGESEAISVPSDYPLKNLLDRIYLSIANQDHEPFRKEALAQARLLSLVMAAANE